MRNLDICHCWRCTLCPCKVRNKFLVNFRNRTILLCIPCTVTAIHKFRGRFEVIGAINMNFTDFWNMTPCNLVERYLCYGVISCSSLQSRRTVQMGTAGCSKSHQISTRVHEFTSHSHSNIQLLLSEPHFSPTTRFSKLYHYSSYVGIHLLHMTALLHIVALNGIHTPYQEAIRV